MDNIKAVREFYAAHPLNPALGTGDDVDFLYIGSDKEMLQDSGSVWQFWADNSVTIVTTDGFRNVDRNHIRKALTDS